MATQPATRPGSASPLDAHRSSKATGSMAIGAVGIVAALISPLLAFGLGLLAMWVAAKAFEEIDRGGCTGRGQAKAGVALGILATLAAFAAWVYVAVTVY